MGLMVIGLASGSLEKLVVTSTVTGGAVALDMDVEIYLLLGGAYAFRKDVALTGTYCEREELQEEMRGGMKTHAVPDPFDNLRKLKADGNVKIHVCATAGKIWGAGAKEDFIDLVDDIVGLAEYIVKCGDAEVVQVF